MSTDSVTLNATQSRFEINTDAGTAELVFDRDGGRLALLHTEVPDELEGQGIGSKLVQAALDTAKNEDLAIVPLCSFVADWLERHPDAAAEVDVEWPGGNRP